MRKRAGKHLTERILQRKRLEEVLLGFRLGRKEAGEVKSWIRAQHEAVGLREAEVAEKLGYEAWSVYRLENSEMRAAIQVKHLQKVAEVMECELVYALVPKEGSLEEMAKKIEEGRRVYTLEEAVGALRKAIRKYLVDGEMKRMVEKAGNGGVGTRVESVERLASRIHALREGGGRDGDPAFSKFSS